MLADYRSYVDCRDRVDELYQNPEEWAYKAMLNIANMGYFSSDRTIEVREIYLAYRPGKAVSQSMQHNGAIWPRCVVWRTFYSESAGRIQAIAGIYY